MYDTVVNEVKKYASDSSKRIYMNHGAKEPIYGVSIGNLKKVTKQLKLKNNHELALELYNSGNYDLMYMSLYVAEPAKMTKEIFNDWVKKAHMYMHSDYVVAKLLSETNFALDLAREWLKSDDELTKSAAYYTYSYLISRDNAEHIGNDEIEKLLVTIRDNIHESQNRVRYAMNNFVITIGIYYTPLHQFAIDVANHIGKVKVSVGKASCKVPFAYDYILSSIEKNNLKHSE